MTNPKVSICIPTYKQPLLLKRVLDSIFIQTYKDWEIIISDDTSGNEIQDFIKSIDNPKIKYFRNINKKSSTANWNFSIEKASGEYIKIIHHDDWFNYDYSLEEFVRMLDENPEADFAFSASYPTGGFKSYKIPSPETIDKLRKNPYSLILFNIVGAPSATIFRKKIKQNFDENLIYTVDWDFYVRVLADNPNFVFSEMDLICITSDSQSQITAKCIGNKEIQLYEAFYSADKFKNSLNIKQIVYLCNLLYQFDIKSKDNDEKLKIFDNFLFDIIIYFNRCKLIKYFVGVALWLLYTLSGHKYKRIVSGKGL